MATLHIVCQAGALRRCIEVATLQDTVLLTGSALRHAGSSAHPRLIALTEQLAPMQVHELDVSGTKTTNYDGFVRLVAEHLPIVSWS